MKANEAPDKLYISDSELNDAEHCVIWFKSQQNEKDIEYTRTDAFIEKAAEYLNNFYNEDTHSYLIDEDIEKFINYMKGE